ncbi:MAG: GHKL domain-containing protein [Deltaproteobacteria bacterium]|nr:GHKL domain-containing protein [Deltaproteobacteria bacterium]
MVLSNENMGPKARPFQLLKHFAWASFIVLAVFSFLFSLVISENAIQILKASYENNVILVGENLCRQVYRNFVYPKVVLSGSSVSLNDPSQAELMDRIVRNAIYGFNVDLVNAYDITKTQIVYSTDPQQIRLEMPQSLEYKKALEGENSSMTFTEEGSWGFGMGAKVALRVYIPFKRPADPNPTERDPFQDVFQLNQGRIYVPFGELVGPDTNEEAPILGVFELNQDMSEQNDSIVRFQVFVFGLSVLIMGLIFLSLLLIVHKAQGMIERRAKERYELVAQIHQAERLAALGEMVASVSHEIKNPLGIIRSTSELLGEMPEADEHHKRLARVITEESTRLNQIVTEFLDFARPEIPSPHDCYLEEIIGGLISFMRPELDKRGIEVNHDLNGRSLKLLADQGLLYRAFLNILINAMESMEDGGGIAIRVEKERESYCIVFEDTGCGISEENADNVLKPFFTTKNKGSGLGLSIVKKIVEAHSGTVDIQSREGEGTKIMVRLPHTEGRAFGS